jgi:N,N'-diacetyllegionaminate synthase
LRTWFRDDGHCLIVAEIGQAHDGSLGNAHAYIDAVARTGADAIKFQTHIADAESTPGEPWRVRFSPQDASRYDYWKRMEFTAEQWGGLAQHAWDRGLQFLSSPFSLAAFELLDKIGMPAWKVGAGEIANLPFLDVLARSGKPVLLSSGLASWQDLDTATARIARLGGSYGIFQCTTAYPCPPEKLGLNVLPEIRTRYGCPTGLSDHSGTIFAGLAAATLGVNMIEVHTVFSRESFGPDTPASITTGELAELVRGVRFINTAQANPVNKAALPEELSQLRTVFGKSIFAARELAAGAEIGRDDMAFKKPGTGIPAARFEMVLGRRLRRRVAANIALSEDDFETQ